MTHRELPDAGLIPHHLLDQLYTLCTTGQLRLRIDTTNVSNPPTLVPVPGGSAGAVAELAVTGRNPVTFDHGTFSTLAEAGAGFLRLLDDNATGANLYLIASDGANWWYLTATKSV
jgi:hypothetical protein